MNDVALKDLNVLKSFLDENCISYPKPNSVEIVVNGTYHQIIVVFTFPANYPDEILRISIVNKHKFPNLIPKNMYNYLNSKSSELKGFSSLIPLYFEVQHLTYIENLNVFNVTTQQHQVVANDTIKRSKSLQYKPAPTLKDTELLLIYLFHKAITSKNEDIDI